MRDSHTIIPTAKPPFHVFLISRLHPPPRGLTSPFLSLHEVAQPSLLFPLFPSHSLSLSLPLFLPLSLFLFLSRSSCTCTFATSTAHLRGSRRSFFVFDSVLCRISDPLRLPLPRRSTPSNLGPSILSRVSRDKSRGKLAGEDSSLHGLSLSVLHSLFLSLHPLSSYDHRPLRSFVSQLDAIEIRAHFLMGASTRINLFRGNIATLRNPLSPTIKRLIRVLNCLPKIAE